MLSKWQLGLALLLCSSLLQGQSTITGTIQDPEGNALPGANIRIPELERGDAADANGSFRIESVPEGSYRLVASFIGYRSESLQVDLRGKDALEVKLVLRPREVELDALVVRATRADERTPMTFTDLGKEALEENNLGQDVPYLLRWTPSAVVTSDAGAGVGYTGIRIRGTDPTRINVTINGIPLNDAESQGVFWVNLPDFISSAESVQVQRGVGTSTNGAGAFGATINLNTFDIKQQAYTRINAGAGSFNTLKGNVQFGSGLLRERFTLEGRLSHIQSDGYIDRASADLNSYFLAGTYTGKRSALQLNLFSGHEITYQAWNGVPPDLLDDPDQRTFNSAGTEKPGEPYENEVDNYRQTHAQVLYNTALGRALTLNLNLHYTRGAGFFEQYKANQQLADYGLVPLPGQDIEQTDLVRRLWLDNHFYGTTYALQYEPERGGLKLTLGGAYNRYEGLHFGEVIWAQYMGDGEKDQRYYENDALKTDFNLFAKANLEVLPGLHTFLDLQFRRVTYRFEGLNRQNQLVDQQVALPFFNPKAGLFYTLSPRSELYASFAVAQREPNRNDYVESTPESRPRPEKLYNTEVGFRKRWDRAALGANIYHMLYRDQLALNGQINDVGAYTRINLERSYRLGIELVGGLQLLEGLRFDATATLSQNRVTAFTEYVDTYDANGNWTGQEPIQHENTNLAFSPAIITSGELRYQALRKLDGHELELALLAKYIGKQYIDNTSDPANVLQPYGFADLRLRYRLDIPKLDYLEFTLLLRNLFDALYETNAWSYRYRYGSDLLVDQGFYPQAGRNILLGLTLAF